MELPTKGQAIAFGRHIVSYSMGALTAGVALHIVSDGQAHDATTAITQISTGVGSILAGCTTLIALASGIWAAWKSSPFATLLQASKLPGVQQIAIRDPKLADKLPDNVVVAPLGRPGQN